MNIAQLIRIALNVTAIVTVVVVLASVCGIVIHVFLAWMALRAGRGAAVPPPRYRVRRHAPQVAPQVPLSAVIRRESAWHEAGHLVAAWVQPDFDTLPLSVWVGRLVGAAAGAVNWPTIAADRSSAPETFAWIVMCLGGRGGELLANGNHTSVEGAVCDVSQAVEQIRDMRRGLAVLTLPGHTAQIRWSEITDAQVLDIAADQAAMIVAAHAEAVASIGQALLDAPNGLSGQQLLTTLQVHLGPKVTVADLSWRGDAL